MATIYLSQSSKTDFKGNSEVLVRFSHGKIDQRAKSNVFIPIDYTDDNGKKDNQKQY